MRASELIMALGLMVFTGLFFATLEKSTKQEKQLSLAYEQIENLMLEIGRLEHANRITDCE